MEVPRLLVSSSLRVTAAELTCSDTVYFILALFSTLIFIPITPFAHKLPQALNIVVAGVVILILAVTWTIFPFSQEWPIRVYFQQSVELASASSGLAINGASGMQTAPLEVVRAETTLTGLGKYIPRTIVPEIPSSRHDAVLCTAKGLRPDLTTCRWATDLIPSPGGNFSTSSPSLKQHWLDVHTTRLNATRALVSVRGANTRGCRLYFDRPVSFLYVHQASDPTHSPLPVPYAKMHMQGGYEMPATGVKEVRLWSRTWDKTFAVEVGWEGKGSEELTGRAACEYAEYASALGGAGSGLIPAYEEVKQFLPLWALPTKLTDGLAEVWTKFSV